MGSPRIVGARFKATDASNTFDGQLDVTSGNGIGIAGTEVINSSGEYVGNISSTVVQGARFIATDASATFDGQLDVTSGNGIGIAGTEVISSSRTLTNIVAGSGSFYETGTFTPEVADATSGGNTATGTFSGNYVKVGTRVTYSISLEGITTAGMTGSNVLYVRDLPFTSLNKLQVGSIVLSSVSYTSGAMIVPQFFSSSTYLQLKEVKASSAFADVIVSEISSGTTAIYITATIITN